LCAGTKRRVLGYDLTVIVSVAIPKRCPALKVLTPSWLFSTLAACEVTVPRLARDRTAAIAQRVSMGYVLAG
jgi:hypothetical protein